jgi:hypothetical protein
VPLSLLPPSLPLFESQSEIGKVCSGVINYIMCKKSMIEGVGATDHAEAEADTPAEEGA